MVEGLNFEDVFSPMEPMTPDWFINDKIKFYLNNKTKITFRLSQMPEYFFTGKIESISQMDYGLNEEGSYKSIGTFILILDNGEKMLFVYSDIMTSSIHPSSIDPIKVFQRKDISEADRKTVFDRCNNKCEIGLKGCTEIAKEIDHIIPVSRGGGNELYNLQGACSSCNRKKYNKI